jgi:S-DNA-T family DNA segregation ATPase FtsK/SpoIIIE
MPETRNVKHDLVALALIAVALFAGVALISFSPFDYPGTSCYPTTEQVHNACGRTGALLAYSLRQGIGWSSYYLVCSAFALGMILLRRQPISDPALRLAGWLASLAGITTFASMYGPIWSSGPMIGAGGYLGATGRGFLEMHFAHAGSVILIASATLGGWMLCTEYFVFGVLRRALGSSLAQFAPKEEVEAASRRRAVRKQQSDLSSTPLSIKTAPKPTAAEAKAAIAASLAPPPAVEPDKEETDEAAADNTLGSRLANALRIRRPNKAEREEVMRELDEASYREDNRNYELPDISLLEPGVEIPFENYHDDLRRQAKILEQTFESFGFAVKVVEVEPGPVIAQFEIELEAGLRLSKITGLADDLAIALRVPSVRIVAPIPGKNTVGIEVPNTERHVVRIREVIEEAAAKSPKMRIPVFLGKDVAGKPMVVDLATLPHLLIAGRTGTGKSVCLNSIIISMLMTRRPDEVRLLMIDPKMVELSTYKSIPHLMHPVVTDMKKAEAILAWAVEKMEERYALLARAGVRHIGSYNQLGEDELMERLQPADDEERKSIPLNLPYIVIVADEMADLMMTSPKEVEHHIIRLAQKSRAVGIHLVLATQKPTVDVITGLIKSNLPARIAFQVASRTDSRVVLDEMGADKLLGNGDMLFLWPGTSTLLRGQGTYVSDDEINAVVASVATSEPEYVHELVQLKVEPVDGKGGTSKLPHRDELYASAVELVIREGRGSVSLLQRALGIGYGRAARLVDFMAEDGIVGQYAGSQAREVLLTLDQWEAMSGSASAEPIATPPPPPRTRSSGAITLAKRSQPLVEEDADDEEEIEDELDDDVADEEDDSEDDPTVDHSPKSGPTIRRKAESA